MAYLKLDSSSASSSSSSSSSCKPCSPATSEPSSSAEPLMAASHKRKAGRKKFKETRHPVFRGVRQRRGDKWVCEVREPNKKSRIWLGTFVSPEMAARAYDVAALALRGNSAVLNFSDSAWILPKAKSSSPKDIQMAALAAAEAFKPTTCSSPSSDNIDQRRGNEVLGQHSSTLVHCESSEAEANESINPLFIDEEALFNMPGLLDSMAEGMLLTPPAFQREVDWDNDDDTIKIDLWGDY